MFPKSPFQKAENLLFRLIRGYTRMSPVRKGKATLMNLAIRLPVSRPEPEIVKLRDGRQFCLYLRSSQNMYSGVYFYGEYERVISQMVKEMVRSGDICFDLGANLGWYTTLMSRLCGPNGQVHAFEPVPFIFEQLQKNVTLSKGLSNCCLNNIAVSNSEGKTSMHVFTGLPNGHSSLSAMNRADFSKFECRMSTVNQYIAEQSIREVDFVKCDIEGAELLALRGATRLFKQKVPPVWIIEISKETLRGFGNLPNEIICFMKEQAPYQFFAIDEARGDLNPIDGFAAEDIGANVLCIPKGINTDRLPAVLRKR
jgi:FkbM family methyltransferase